MTEHHHKRSPNAIKHQKSITKPGKLAQHVGVPIPLPNIVILVHGVNDAGEAYSAQEEGICAGLNHRLNRGQTDKPDGRGDLKPANYNMPPPNPPLVPDPDAVFYRRNGEAAVSPMIPFYWGFREEEEMIKKDLWHGQWTDRFGTRIDKNGAKEGGPFANASTNLNAFWGHGFTGQVGGSEWLAEKNSTPLHDLRESMPRYYMLLAGKRLAMLIRMIKAQAKYKNCAVNLVCHSQGGMITLLAHAILQDEAPGIAADTVILQNPPYSFEEPLAERKDGKLADLQQTTQSRVKSFANIVNYVGKSRATLPTLYEIDAKYSLPTGLYGPHWQAGAGAKQWIGGKEYSFEERDNRGKVYLYFCPYDATVGLVSVQGIGWSGVPKDIEASGTADTKGKQATQFVEVLPTLDVTCFRQRIFTERKVNGVPELVGLAPHTYEMRRKGENSPTGEGMTNPSAKIEVGWRREISGEELHPKLEPQLRLGEDSAGMLTVGPIDAMIAIASKKDSAGKAELSLDDTRPANRQGQFPLSKAEIEAIEDKLPGQKAGTTAKDVDKRLRVVSAEKKMWKKILVNYTTETIEESRLRWQRSKDENSHHSAIPANALHAERVTAYDLSLGAPLPQVHADAVYMAYFRAVADWRTDWGMMKRSSNERYVEISKLFGEEKDKSFKELIFSTNTYYLTGKLPESIAVAGQTKMAAPQAIVSQTRKDRAAGIAPEHRANPSTHKFK